MKDRTSICCKHLLILLPLALCATAVQAEDAAGQAAQSLRSTSEPGRMGQELSTPPAQSEPNPNQDDSEKPVGQ